MKKLLTLFAVLALTAPVFAADGDPNVLITCEDEGGNVVSVSYQLLDEDGSNPGLANLMRGIALDITVDGGATIDAISDYDADGFTPPVDSEGIDDVSGYIVYMGSIQFAADPNYVSSFGDPVAPNTDPDALGGIGTSGITVEMGSLYSEDGTAPGASGTLFKFTVSGATNVTIAANTTRGSCVLEDGSPANVVAPGCSVGGDCMATTNPAYADWVAEGKPDCWCYEFQCRGDADGITVGAFPVNSADVTALRAALFVDPLPVDGICADFDHIKVGSFRVNSADVTVIRAALFVDPLVSCPDINEYKTP